MIALCLGLGSAAGLANGLVSCGAPAPGDRTRPLSADEAARLATMRLHNYQDGRTGLRGTLGHRGEEIQLAGWIDWQRPLAYLSVTGPRPGPADGLVQALPGIVAARPGRLTAPAGVSAPPASPVGPVAPVVPASPAAPASVAPAGASAPPPDPPSDGWRIRPFGLTGPEGAPLDTLLLLLFTVAANQVDTADLLVHSDARWLRADAIDGVPVDVLLGPAVPPRPTTTPPTLAPLPAQGRPAVLGPYVSAPPSPTPAARPGSLAAQGGAVTYWLDADARLRRLEAVVGRNVPVRLDFQRTDRRELVAIDELGGRPVRPRRVTAAEADVLARLRQRDRTTGGGTFAVQLPGEDANLVTAAGWLDWRNAIAYAAVQDTDTPAEQALVRADRTGVTILSGTKRTVDGRPQLPPPRGAWRRSTWQQRSDDRGAGDLDLLLNEALSLANPAQDSADLLRRTAVWLRTDTIGGMPVAVYEIPKPAERGMPGGAARMRYWVDTSGVLRRLELRGRSGGFGRLDIRLGEQVPYLPAVKAV